VDRCQDNTARTRSCVHSLQVSELPLSCAVQTCPFGAAGTVHGDGSRDKRVAVAAPVIGGLPTPVGFRSAHSSSIRNC